MNISEMSDRYNRMDRRSKSMVVLIVIFAVVLLILLLRLNADWSQKKNRVLVTTEELVRGSRIMANQVRWAEYPSSQIKKGFYQQSNSTVTSVVGAVAVRDIPAGEAITTNNTIARNVPPDFQALLQPGMRAVTIPVPDANSGFVRSGDYVDILLTFDASGVGSTDKKSFSRVSKTLLKNILVLGVYPPAGLAGARESGANMLSRVVTGVDNPRGGSVQTFITFELTPKQAEMVNVAKTMGTVSLSLQGHVIGKSKLGISYTTSQAVASLGRKGPGKQRESEAVTVIRGTEKEVITLER